MRARRTVAASLVLSVVSAVVFLVVARCGVGYAPAILKSRVSISSRIRSPLVLEARKHSLGKSLAQVVDRDALWSALDQQVPSRPVHGPVHGTQCMTPCE